jgi:hypothetical protein
MPTTYEPIQTQTVGTATASITFSSIPATYTDLILVFNGSMDSGENSLGLRFNSDTGTNYSSTALYGSGSTPASLRQTNTSKMYMGRADTTVSPNIFHIMNYTNSTSNKTAIAKGLDASIVMLNAGLWRSTAAITSITLSDFEGRNITVGSVATLYGIKAA